MLGLDLSANAKLAVIWIINTRILLCSTSLISNWMSYFSLILNLDISIHFKLPFGPLTKFFILLLKHNIFVMVFTKGRVFKS